MDIWKILGIEPTKDRKAITQAYREKLVNTNPEDKPDEFKQLRNAYEEALKYAENQGLRTEKTPVELWVDKLDDLYKVFRKRNDVSCWKELLNEDVCKAIDSRMAVEDALLKYLMSSYFITHDVWVYLDQEFGWRDRAEELYEKYPKDFIDYVIINGINYTDTLPMAMFSPGEDGDCCHKYLDLYVKIRKDASEKAAETIQEMLSLKEKHPYGEALAVSYRIHFEDETALDELRNIQKQYPDDAHLGMMLANELARKELYEEEKQLCEDLLGKNPEHMALKWLYANALAGLGEYESAIKQINEMMRAAGGNTQQIYDLDQKRQQWNVIVIEQKQKHIAEHPEDSEAKTDLCWAYLENNRIDEAVKLSESIEKDKVDKFNYYNLMSNICFVSERNEEGMRNLDELIKVIRELPDDGDPETVKRKKRLGEMYGRKGYFYHSVFKDNEKAMEAYETALQLAKDKADILTQLTQMSIAEGEYEKAADYARELVKELPDSYHSYLLLGYACFYLHNDREAFDALNRSLDMNRSDLGLYILKVRILVRNDAFEEAQEIVDFLLENNLEEDPSVMYCHGLLKENRDNDPDGAMELYQQAAEKLGDTVTSYSFGDDLYYRLLCIRGDKLDATIKEDRAVMMELADKGLKCNDKHRGLLDYKAWLLRKEERYKEALDIYLKLAENPNHGPGVDRSIGYIYYQDLNRSAEKAREWYQRSLDRKGDYSALFYLGMCNMYLGNLDEAERNFLELQKNEPDTLDSYFRLSYLYLLRNDMDRALVNINEVIKIVDRQKGDHTRYYYQKVRILRRMERWQEAIDVVRDMVVKFDYKYASKVIFDIYVQSGNFMAAREHLASWKKSRKNMRDYWNAAVTLDMLQNNFLKAKFNRATFASVMDKERALELEHLIDKNNEDYRREVKALEKILGMQEQEKDSDLSRVYGNLAYAYFHLNNPERQKYYADKALQVIDEFLSQSRLDLLLYKTRKIRALALAGRCEEAADLLEQCRNHSLCEHCNYCACKDLTDVEMELYEITGNKGKAYLTALSGRKEYPDEEDFVIMANILAKKV
ncbi:MAG: tetratricopeptide repeat protein [Erysipelotrichaceae bacterium]|nr:tetratricopeptide repeat protein [Erysipelotrichaceae bacterium]